MQYAHVRCGAICAVRTQSTRTQRHTEQTRQKVIVLIFIQNNLRGDDNFNIAMNRMKAADITQLRYLFDMYYCVFYNKNMIENPESIFSFLSSVGKVRN